jgi:K+-transporting ATPase ATPase C chain
LDRVASKWAIDLNRNPNEIRQEIQQLLQKNAYAPLAGLAGDKLVNVLEINLKLQQRYGSS